MIHCVASVTTNVIQSLSLTNAGVKTGVRFEDVIRREVNSVTGEAEMAADGGFWLQLCNSVSLSRGTRSCRAENTETLPASFHI